MTMTANKPPKHHWSHAERERLAQQHSGMKHWYAWGPYLSERQWGTVREDYSPDGSAWEYLSHDMARSVAYRWGEDGIGGFCDAQQRLCVSVALWNGKDPILKERLFGLTNQEGNHGEDVKELYHYLNATPTHSYMRMLYRYPQCEFPYHALVAENAWRGVGQHEYELLDTGAFADKRYFDVFVEYAKASVNDIVMRVSVVNRGAEAAELAVLPQVWFRNTWSWRPDQARPELRQIRPGRVETEHPEMPGMAILFDEAADPLFTDNDTNPRRQWDRRDVNGHFKDGFHEHLIDQLDDAVRPDSRGTKLGLLHQLVLEPGQSEQIYVRLCQQDSCASLTDAEAVVSDRLREADAFYDTLQADITDEDHRMVHRQALAGMIWSKQFYDYDVERWLRGDPEQPAPPASRWSGRNADWQHIDNADIISMPDKWEYPWYAAWDLAFHCIPLALVDPGFAKDQLKLVTREWYMHPNGQIPAYEWSFSDVNPPVHAWATWRVFQIDRKQRRLAGNPEDPGDLAFLESVFHKLMLNFTWWVNRKDSEGHNVFQGGFLGLDNIGVFDRSAQLPTGGHISQADGTSWMAMYALNLMRIALELAQHNPVYEDIATKFFEHFLHIAQAMTNIAGEGIGLWDEQDQFYYDVLNLPNGNGGHHRLPMRLRSIVGLIPLFAVETIDPDCLNRLPGFSKRMDWVLDNKPELAALVSRWFEPCCGERRLLSLLRGHRMKRLLKRMLDESEFLSPYGVRSVSKVYKSHPYTFEQRGVKHEVSYSPGESTTSLFGGNSNWRGPVWMPINYLLIESLQKFHHYYGDDFKVECPTGSGNEMTLLEVAEELSNRLLRIFTRDESGQRPVFGKQNTFYSSPDIREHMLFYEYFHGDNGRGLGASHQTGWTGLVAKLIQPRRPTEPSICHQ